MVLLVSCILLDGLFHDNCPTYILSLPTYNENVHYTTTQHQAPPTALLPSIISLYLSTTPLLSSANISRLAILPTAFGIPPTSTPTPLGALRISFGFTLNSGGASAVSPNFAFPRFSSRMANGSGLGPRGFGFFFCPGVRF